jgi:type II secretory pathway pseudopilin PulG
MPAPGGGHPRAARAGPRSATTVAVMVIAALVVSIVAAAGSVGAVWYSRCSAKSAAVSAAAASAAAALDSQRRHDELTPEFDISITAGKNGVSDHAEMRVALTGPAGLDKLDGPVRLQITCGHGGEQWILLREVQVSEPPPALEQ